MDNFYIQKLIAKGKGKKDAEVKFVNGLNIITGPSNSGKSMIASCIDYLFGKNHKDEVPFTKSTGYDSIEIVIKHLSGTYVVKRTLHKSALDVSYIGEEKADNLISTGRFSANTSAKNNISKFWLKLIGIEEEHKIITNQSFTNQKLGWRTFSHSLLIDEDYIIQKSSILLPSLNQRITAFYSALLFLLYGKDFSEYDTLESRSERKIRKEAISGYISDNLNELIKEREKLLTQYQSLKSIDVEAEIKQLVISLSQIETEIDAQLEISQTLFGNIVSAEENLAEKELLLERCQALESQYDSDIERLSFIVNGETLIDNHTHEHPNHICPFCEGEIPDKNKISYIEASQAELNHLLLQLRDLEKSKIILQREIESLESELSSLQDSEYQLNQFISKELKPKANQISLKIEQYRSYIQVQEQLIYIEKLQKKYNFDIDSIEKEKSNTLTYKPKEQFDKDFWKTMSQNIYSILEYCHYENLVNVKFDPSSFDMIINGIPKVNNQGKGFRAFLNTVLSLAYRKLLHDFAKFKPGIMLIDTPLLGLDEGQRTEIPENMQNGLFSYFINHQNEGQLIIIENSNELPPLNYQKFDVNVIEFTHDKNKGRFGFLYDINP